MKTLKNLLLYGFLTLAIICPIVFGVLKFSDSQFSSSNKANAETLPATFFDNLTLTKEGQILSYENVIEYENSNYIVANGSITITLNPFKQNFQVYLGSHQDDFFVTTDRKVIERNPATGGFNNSFEHNGTTYYFTYSQTTHTLNIYDTAIINNQSHALASTNVSTVLSVDETEDNLIINYVKSYTWKSTAGDTIFTVGTNSLYLLRPKINFSNASNEVIMFNTHETDDSGIPFPPTDTIKREQQFSQVDIEFIDNSYTEENPLYFRINFNGFIYSFKLFTKNYEGKNLLFVNYIDSDNENNNQFLGTGVDSSTSLPFNDITSANNYLSLIFTNTGRYGFEVYDSSYLCKMNDANYYSTSFYIVDETATEFENIYMIAQTLDDDHNPIEYIVSTSTINYSTMLTIKNLDNLAPGSNLEDIIDSVEVIKAIFGASNNEPVHTLYSVSEILEMIENGDFNLIFDDDAYYEVYIYPKDSSLEFKKYSFTIVKQAKTSMTIQGERFEATEPYKTTIKDYEFNINSSVKLMVKFTTTSPTSDTTINKTYVNKYQIRYGMQQVSIEQGAPPATDSEEEQPTDSMTLYFKGVGNLVVTVNFNGKISTYNLNSEAGNNSITFTEYGSYSVYMVDSMGTEASGIYTLEKELGISSILLIVFSVILLLFITIFILITRSRIKTR